MTGRGRMMGPKAGGPNGKCICPSCGYKTPHTRARPCYTKKCPSCGATLTRQ